MRLPSTVPLCASLALVLAVMAAANGQTRDDEEGFGLRRALEPAPQAGGDREPVGPAEIGSPSGSGAGTTGFIATNLPPRTAVRASAQAVPAGAAATAPNIEEVTGTVPRRPDRRRLEEEDPFAPVGIRVGSFEVRPSVEVSAGYDDNPLRITGGKGSRLTMVEARVDTQSDWSRHELSSELRGAYTKYHDVDNSDRPEAEARLRGRIDVSSLSRIELEGSATLTTADPGSPEAVTSAVRPPHIYTLAASAGYVQQFNRFELGVHGDVERTTNESAKLISGEVEDLSVDDYNSYGLRVRGGYEVTPGVQPFIEAGFDRRVYDHKFDLLGMRTGSDGIRARAGLSFAHEGLLTGEASVGYARRHYRDPARADISGLTVDSSLIWIASALTTVSLRASTDIDETSLLEATGVVRREAAVTVDHAFRRWLVGSLGAGYTQYDYRGIGRRDDYLALSASLTYHLNRYAALKTEVRREQLRSNFPGEDYTAHIVLFGLRLQR